MTEVRDGELSLSIRKFEAIFLFYTCCNKIPMVITLEIFYAPSCEKKETQV
jgi:hypothetical protein